MAKIISIFYVLFRGGFWGMLIFGSYLNYLCLHKIIEVRSGKTNYSKKEVIIIGYENTIVGEGGYAVTSIGQSGSEKYRIPETLIIDSTYTIWYNDINLSTSLANSKTESNENFKKRLIKDKVQFISYCSLIIAGLFILKVIFTKLAIAYNAQDIDSSETF